MNRRMKEILASKCRHSTIASVLKSRPKKEAEKIRHGSERVCPLSYPYLPDRTWHHVQIASNNVQVYWKISYFR